MRLVRFDYGAGIDTRGREFTVDSGPRSHLATARRTAALALVFCLTTAATWVAIRMVATPDAALIGRVDLTEKVMFLRAEPEPFDVYLIGNSSTYRSFDPAVMDGVMADAGCALRTYNLAIPALSVEEAKTVIDVALEDNPNAVLVLGPTSPPTYDLDHAFDLQRSAFLEPDDLQDVIDLQDGRKPVATVRSAALIAAAQIPVGHLHYSLYEDRIRNLDLSPAGLASLPTGYRSLESELDDPVIARRRAEHVRTVDELGMDGWLEQRARLQLPLHGVPREWAALVDHIDGRAQTITILPPSTIVDVMTGIEARWRANGGAPLISMHDPADHEFLTREESWFDQGHVSDGAVPEVSRLAATELCRTLTEADRAEPDPDTDG